MRISDWSSDVCSSDLFDDLVGIEHEVLAQAPQRRICRIGLSSRSIVQPAASFDTICASISVRRASTPATRSSKHAPSASHYCPSSISAPSLSLSNSVSRPGSFVRFEEPTSELPSPMPHSYTALWMKKQTNKNTHNQ